MKLQQQLALWGIDVRIYCDFGCLRDFQKVSFFFIVIAVLIFLNATSDIAFIKYK